MINKNTGAIFGACVIAGWLLSTMIALGHGRKIMLSLAVASIGALGLLVLVSGYSEAVISLGNRNLVIQPDNVWLIPRNELYILFINSSFGIAPWLLVFPVAFLLPSSTASIDKRTVGAALTPWLVSLTTLVFLMGAQLTDYGFLYASPGQDTGSSRLTLPVMVCASLSIAWLVRFTPTNRVA